MTFDRAAWPGEPVGFRILSEPRRERRRLERGRRAAAAALPQRSDKVHSGQRMRGQRMRPRALRLTSTLDPLIGSAR